MKEIVSQAVTAGQNKPLVAAPVNRRMIRDSVRLIQEIFMPNRLINDQDLTPVRSLKRLESILHIQLWHNFPEIVMGFFDEIERQGY